MIDIGIAFQPALQASEAAELERIVLGRAVLQQAVLAQRLRLAGERGGDVLRAQATVFQHGPSHGLAGLVHRQTRQCIEEAIHARVIHLHRNRPPLAQRTQHRAQHRAQLVAAGQLQLVGNRVVGHLVRELDPTPAEEQRGARGGERLGQVAELTHHLGCVQVASEVAQVVERLDGHGLDVGEELQGIGGPLGGDGLVTGHSLEPAVDGPVEVGHGELARHGVQQGAHPVLFHRLDHHDGMKRQDQELQVMKARRVHPASAPA